MKHDWEDYYKILQVHFMAEPDIIKSAYLRLSKKYHPDNMNPMLSEEKMKSINKAYSVLSDPVKRNEYAMRWVEKYSEHNKSFKQDLSSLYVNISIEPARLVLLNYFLAISKGDYLFAYELLSDRDKKKIGQKEFVKWQTLVGEVFELLEFSCEFDGLFKDIKINNCYFETCIKMRVKVVEKNLLMDRIEEDTVYKNMINEKDTWRVYLGYTNLKGIIDKFNTLAHLNKKRAESVLNVIPLLQDKKEFMVFAQREQLRYNRYGNIFTLVLCEINNVTYEVVEQVLNQLLRKLDIFCKWQHNTYILLLPETNAKTAHLVINRIIKGLELYSTHQKNIDIKFKAVEQHDATLEDLMTKLLLKS